MVQEQIEPFGEAGAYLRAGIIAATIANVNRASGAKTYSPFDFVPQFMKPISQQPPQDPMAFLRMLRLLADQKPS